jgi:hypothetical protein
MREGQIILLRTLLGQLSECYASITKKRPHYTIHFYYCQGDICRDFRLKI